VFGSNRGFSLESNILPFFAAFIALRLPVQVSQTRRKHATASDLEFGGMPKRSSSQNDLYSPDTSDPAVDDVTDRRRLMM
jgi:hypothetical protein